MGQRPQLSDIENHMMSPTCLLLSEMTLCLQVGRMYPPLVLNLRQQEHLQFSSPLPLLSQCCQSPGKSYGGQTSPSHACLQQPGSPRCPQQVCHLLILSQLRTTNLLLRPKGIGALKFRKYAFKLGRLCFAIPYLSFVTCHQSSPHSLLKVTTIVALH